MTLFYRIKYDFMPSVNALCTISIGAGAEISYNSISESIIMDNL
jgi:hypothetical protein